MEEKNVWGFCMRVGEMRDRLLTPNGVTYLDKGESLIMLTNNTNSDMHIRKGEVVAAFLEANREEYDLLAIDLETMEYVDLEKH